MNTSYTVDGAGGAPWLTFVTGIANDLTLWEGQARALKDRFRVLRYDLRGHGGTQATPGEYSFELLTRDLIELWDALGIQRSHLVGIGLGGALAQSVAITHGERLLGLIPCCCRAKMVPDFAEMWHGLLRTVREKGIEAIVEPTAQRWFSAQFKAANPQVLDAVRKMIRRTSLEGYIGCVGAFLTLDLEGELSWCRRSSWRLTKVRAPGNTAS